MAALSRMLYVSRSRIDTSDHATMKALVEKAAANNTRERITGVLTWSEDAFLQMVEGPRAALCELLWRLNKDERHTDLLLIEFRPAAGRTTQTWSMAAPNPSSRAGLADLTYDRIRTMTPDTLIRRLADAEASTSLSIMSQLEVGGDTILV